MKIKEAMGDFSWKNKGEDDKGSYFILTDSQRGHDYEVTVVKDTGNVQVNGSYLKTMPRDIQEFVAMKLNQCGCKHKGDSETKPKAKSKSESETKNKPKAKGDSENKTKSKGKHKE